MKTQLGFRGAAILCAWLAAVAVLPGQAQQAAAPARSGRTYQAIESDRGKTYFQYNQVFSEGRLGFQVYTLAEGRAFGTPEARKATAAKLMGPLNRLIELDRELEPVTPMEAERANLEPEILLFRIIQLALEDAESRRVNSQMLAAGGGDAALAGMMRAAADYLAAGHDAAGQRDAVNRLERVFASVGKDVAVDMVPKIFEMNPPVAEVTAPVVVFLKADTRCRFSHGVAVAVASHARRNELSKHPPLVIEQTLVDGSKFSTATWRGKVILVDFWETTCAPCVAEIPRFRSLYGANHGKGLEIISYSSDASLPKLEAFLAKNPGCPWPQMFDATNPGWEPMVETFGLESAPTTFLIDRKGILRRVQVGPDKELEVEVGKLLREAP